MKTFLFDVELTLYRVEEGRHVVDTMTLVSSRNQEVVQKFYRALLGIAAGLWAIVSN